MRLEASLRNLAVRLSYPLARASYAVRDNIVRAAESNRVARLDRALAVLTGEARMSGDVFIMKEPSKGGSMRVSSPAIRKMMKRLERMQ